MMSCLSLEVVIGGVETLAIEDYSRDLARGYWIFEARAT